MESLRWIMFGGERLLLFPLSAWPPGDHLNGQSILNVKLSDATQDLDEVVVVAYGTAKKSTFTGSASVVKAEKLEKIMGSGFAEALQGMSAGVNVVNVQGNPRS